MKHIIAVIMVMFIVFSSSCLADKNVTLNPVGESTQSLRYKVVDSGIDYWTDSIGTKEVFAFIAIKNEEKKKAIYLDSGHFDFENDNGKIMNNYSSIIYKAPDVINPGETGYFYVSSMEVPDISHGVNLIAQFSLQEAGYKVPSYEISETKLSWKKELGRTTGKFRGRIHNNTSKDDDIVNVVVVFKDSNKKVLWIDHAFVNDLFSGSTLGFDIDMMFATPNLKKGAVKSFKTIAKPDYYQW